MFYSKSRRRKKSTSHKRRSKSRRRNPSARARGRRRSRSTSRRRKNPVFRARRRSTSRRRRTNPVFKSRRRSRSTSRRRRNPSFAGSLRSGFDPKFLTNALLTSGGLVLGTKSASFISALPVVGSAGRFLGAVNLVLGGVLAGLTRNPHLKSLAVGFAAGGAYNLIASNVSALGLTALQGDQFLGLEVNGEQPLVAMGGVEVNGEDNYVLMGGDGAPSWGGKW